MRREFYNCSLSSREAVRIELPPYRVYYFKNFADKGVEICVKIFYPASGGAAKISDALSSIACGYYNNFQIEYKCILVHLKRLIPYAFSFSSKSTETLLSELQKAAKGNAVAQAILRYQQDNSFKCKSDSDQISIQKFFPTCGLMDEYFRWLLL